MLDLKITGGTLLDGSGADPLRGDVGIVGDIIVALGDLSEVEAQQFMANEFEKRRSSEREAKRPGASKKIAP